MSNEKYLIDINDKTNWLRVNMDMGLDGKLTEEQRIIIYPEGTHQRFEFTDSIFYGQTAYHEHTYGWETFFMVDGSMDFTVHGKTCTVNTGDVLFVPPYCSHQMIFQQPTRWRATFHDINMCGILNNWNSAQRFFPSQMGDPAFTTSYLANKENIVREPSFAERVDKSEVSEVRTIDKWLCRYDFEGICMKQIIARWENMGVNETWRFEMEDGFGVDLKPIVPNGDLFYITEGEVAFQVGGESFTAYHDCLVKIPSYVPRSFRSKGKSVMYDIGGMTHWLDMAEDYLSIRHNKPEKLNDKDYMNTVLTRHECYVQSFGLKNK
jgi:mannose-6-phosphate isomerase-like protein (cupin superfamily)